MMSVTVRRDKYFSILVLEQAGSLPTANNMSLLFVDEQRTKADR